MTILATIIGALVGSFLNVCIHRLPRGESLFRPGSHCSHCRRILQWQDLIPVLSFLWLRGRCRFCQTSIPVYHLIVEVLTALVWMRLFQIYGPAWLFLTTATLCSLLIVIAFIDLRWFCIPNSLVLIGLFIALIQRFILEGATVFSPFIGLSAGAIMLWLPGLLGRIIGRQNGMGAGDIKFAAVLGLFLGWQNVVLVVWLACLIGAIYGMIGMLSGRLHRKSRIPLGFFLSLISVGALVASHKLEHWLTLLPIVNVFLALA